MYTEHLELEMHFPIEIMFTYAYKASLSKAGYIRLFNLHYVWIITYLKQMQNIVVKKVTHVKKIREKPSKGMCIFSQ